MFTNWRYWYEIFLYYGRFFQTLINLQYSYEKFHCRTHFQSYRRVSAIPFVSIQSTQYQPERIVHKFLFTENNIIPFYTISITQKPFTINYRWTIRIIDNPRRRNRVNVLDQLSPSSQAETIINTMPRKEKGWKRERERGREREIER